MKYFGDNPPPDYALGVVTVPVGQLCAYCNEPIAQGDEGFLIPHFTITACAQEPWHFNCHIRSIAGSVAHLERRCDCFVPGSTENDPPELTRRQAADAAAQAFMGRKR